MKVCKYCGDTFRPKRSDQKFCCPHCQARYWTEKRAERDKKIRQHRRILKNNIFCPWEQGLIHGPARNADPVLGF